MRPTSVNAPATQKQPMNDSRELNLLRLRIPSDLFDELDAVHATFVAAELAVCRLLHAEIDRARCEQRRARLARKRVFDLDALLVELVDQAPERLALVAEIAALHADPDVHAEQQRERNQADDEAPPQSGFFRIEHSLARQQFEKVRTFVSGCRAHAASLSTTRIPALRARGLRCFSCSVGFCLPRVMRRTFAVQLQLHTGWRGGHRQLADHIANACLTMRSSSE